MESKRIRAAIRDLRIKIAYTNKNLSRREWFLRKFASE
jgi:hypothetical protein